MTGGFRKTASRVAAGLLQGMERPDGWRLVALRDIAEIVGGITKGQKRQSGQALQNVPYLRVANVQRGFLDLSEVKEIEASEQEIAALLLRPGDILFNEGGDRDKLGRGWVWSGEIPHCIHQNHVFRARLRDSDDEPKFISYYANSVGQKYFYAEGKHTTNLASINLTKLGALPIPLPSPVVQRGIVAEIEKQLTRINAGVASVHRVQTNLKRFRAAVLKAACEGRLVPTEAELARREGRRHETGGELLERALAQRRAAWSGAGKYKEPPGADSAALPPPPEGWMWTTLDQLLVLLRNGISAKPDADKGLPILRISAVRPLSVNLDDVRYLSASVSEFPSYVLSEGDLLFTRYNGNPALVGVCGVVPTLSSPLVHPDKLIRGRLVQGIVHPRFIAIMSNVGASREHLAKRVRTTAGQSGISGADLKCLPIQLAPFAEQARIVAEVERRLSAADALETLLSANLLRASRLRQSVLQRAFSGALVSLGRDLPCQGDVICRPDPEGLR